MPIKTQAAVSVSPSSTTASLKKQIGVAFASTGASLLAVFLIDIIAVVYISLLHNEQALAAYGVAKLFIFFISTIVSAFTVACGALLSRLIGLGQQHAAGAFIKCLFTVALACIALMVTAQWAGFSLIAHGLGLQGEIEASAHHYVSIVAPAMVVMAAAHLNIQVMRTYGRMKTAMAITLAGTAVFATIAPVLMFVLELGLTGTAIAYGVAAIVTAVACRSRLVRVPATSVSAPLWPSVRTYAPMLLRVAFPAWLGNLATFVSLAYLLHTLVAFGAPALAAMTVIDRLIQTFYCFFFAIPIALAPIIGHSVGAREPHRVRDAIAHARRLVLIYGVCVWLFSMGLSTSLARWASLSPEGSAMLVQVLIFAGPLWILVGREFVAVAIFVSFKAAWYVPVFAWLRATLGTVPFVWLGASLYGSSGAFIGMLVGGACFAVIASIFSQRVSLKWQSHALNTIK
ncbi:MATE family efflux transporter [Pseudomonas sp. nanlin1]|uniref:MATE family efflux transporter n=1 Tax=Pseudomonas sp. nanlin1 TaxID=3040605 RepID=UPI00388E50C8